MYVLPAMVHASKLWCEKACSEQIQAMQIELGGNAYVACTIVSKSGDGSVHKGADPVQKDEALSCGEQKKRSRVKITLCRLFTSSEDDCYYTIRTSFSEKFRRRE